MSASSNISPSRECESVRQGETCELSELLGLAYTEQVEHMKRLDAQLAELPTLLEKRKRLILLISRMRATLNLPPLIDSADKWWLRRLKQAAAVEKSTSELAGMQNEAKP